MEKNRKKECQADSFAYFFFILQIKLNKFEIFTNLFIIFYNY